MMESITKAGRSVSNGVYRVAGAFARGARRVLSYVPLLGVAVAPPELEEVEEAETSSLVRYSPNYFVLSLASLRSFPMNRLTERSHQLTSVVSSIRG